MFNDIAQKALLVSESRYRRIFEAAQDGILLLNADTAQIEDINPYLIDLLGYSHDEYLGKKLWEAGPFAERAESKEIFPALQATGYVRYENIPLITKAGAKITVEFVSNTYDCGGIKVMQCNIRDISKRKAAEAKVQRHMNLCAALSQCNKAIIHCASEEDLFLQICRAAVQFGGMKLAWVGLVDNETRMVRPVASFGDHTEYLKDMNISVDADTPFGCGPTGTSIRENRLYWCPALQDDPATSPWSERSAHAGWVTAASLPLHREGIVIGAFVLYSGESETFDEEVRDLLVEMATNINFALANFARDSQRTKTEKEIVFKNAVLLTQQETSLDAILLVDENGVIISYNQQFIDLWRLSPLLVSARLDVPVLQAVLDQVENSEAFAAQVGYLYEHRDARSRDEILLKDGRVIDRYSAPVTGADNNYYGRVWYFRAITERKQAEARIAFLNRVYAVLSGINSLIVRVRDCDELFREACRIAVEVSGFRMAMICIVDRSTRKFVQTASAGKNDTLMNEIKNILSSTELASVTMVARVIREKNLSFQTILKAIPDLCLPKIILKPGSVR